MQRSEYGPARQGRRGHRGAGRLVDPNGGGAGSQPERDPRCRVFGCEPAAPCPYRPRHRRQPQVAVAAQPPGDGSVPAVVPDRTTPERSSRALVNGRRSGRPARPGCGCLAGHYVPHSRHPGRSSPVTDSAGCCRIPEAASPDSTATAEAAATTGPGKSGAPDCYRSGGRARRKWFQPRDGRGGRRGHQASVQYSRRGDRECERRRNKR